MAKTDSNVPFDREKALKVGQSNITRLSDGLKKARQNNSGIIVENANRLVLIMQGAESRFVPGTRISRQTGTVGE